jgi:hypothetical protein
MAENTNNPAPEKKGDKNSKPRFNSNWIFAILAVSMLLFNFYRKQSAEGNDKHG